MKVALIETIEALVTAIKSKFLTKTEAKSTYATQNWVTSNYYNTDEMYNNYYNVDETDSLLSNYLNKSGGTMTGSLTAKDVIIKNGKLYANTTSTCFLEYYVDGNGNKNIILGGGDTHGIGFGSWAEMSSDHFYQKGYIHAQYYMRINYVLLKYDPSNSTLNISRVDGAPVKLAVNGNVIA